MTGKNFVLDFPLLFMLFSPVSTYEWLFQSSLFIEDAGPNYGNAPSSLIGRGFSAIISGFSDGSKTSPGIYVHTTDNGRDKLGRSLWSQQAKLVPGNSEPITGSFGSYTVSDSTTIFVSSPLDHGTGVESGAVYVFNGTMRNWTQVQKIIPPINKLSHSHFGKLLQLDGNRLIISSDGEESTQGAAYIYERAAGDVIWSVQARLVANLFDSVEGSHFGRAAALSGDFAIVGSRNDDYQGQRTGCAYVFKRASEDGSWSQQQKIVRRENYRLFGTPNATFFASTIALSGTSAFFGSRFLNGSQPNDKTIFVFELGADGIWSFTQTLFSDNTYHSHAKEKGISDMNIKFTENTLVATSYGPHPSVTYLFKNNGTAGSLWRQQAMIVSPTLNMSYPSLWGGHLLFGSGGEVIIYSVFRNNSCLVISMADHFGDGWGSAVLTVRAPDGTNDTFQSRCDRVNPFRVRYCPYSPADSGLYEVKIFAAATVPSHWELSFEVLVESTGVVYGGDFSTKMLFHFDSSSLVFSYYDGRNIVNMSSFHPPECRKCADFSQSHLTWQQLQLPDSSVAVISIVVDGADFFLSDMWGRKLFMRGLACSTKKSYQCFVALPMGIYSFRIGSGVLGWGQRGLPTSNSSWHLCKVQGNHRTQLLFEIVGGTCVVRHRQAYSNRCLQPDLENITSTEVSALFGTDPGPFKYGH